MVLRLSCVQTLADLAVDIAMIRFLGPECLVLTATTTVQRWFVRRRGRAMAVLSLSTLLLQAQPAYVSLLISATGWRAAYRWIAGAIALALVSGGCLLRDSPESAGLAPDGVLSQDMAPPSLLPGQFAPLSGVHGAMATVAPATAAEDEGAEVSCEGTVSLPPLPLSCVTASLLAPSACAPPPPPLGCKAAAAASAAARPSAPLAASTLCEAASHGLFWLLAARGASFGSFWSGFNYNYLSYIRSLGGELSHLTNAQIGAAVFIPIALCGNGAGTLLHDRLHPRARPSLSPRLADAATCALLCCWVCALAHLPGVFSAAGEHLRA